MVNASLTYEILLYLNSFYFGMFGPCEVGMGVLKGVNLTYTKDSLLRDALLLVSLLIAESIRIYCGRHGSLSDHGETIIVSFFWCSPRQKIYFCERTWLLFFFCFSRTKKWPIFVVFLCNCLRCVAGWRQLAWIWDAGSKLRRLFECFQCVVPMTMAL